MNGVCTKMKLNDGVQQTSFSECLLKCSPQQLLWPQPQNITRGGFQKITLISSFLNYSYIKGKTLQQ